MEKKKTKTERERWKNIHLPNRIRTGCRLVIKAKVLVQKVQQEMMTHSLKIILRAQQTTYLTYHFNVRELIVVNINEGGGWGPTGPLHRSAWCYLWRQKRRKPFSRIMCTAASFIHGISLLGICAKFLDNGSVGTRKKL